MSVIYPCGDNNRTEPCTGREVAAYNLKFSGKTISGKVLIGSLITLHKPSGDEYYIHDGYYQGCSGFHYIPKNCQVLKHSIKIIEESEEE